MWVEGEVGQVSISAAGHCYFTLKDERAQLKCVIFRDDRLMMPFEARTGPAPHRPGQHRCLRGAGRLSAVRPHHPAVGLRRSGAAIRGAQGQARRRGTVRKWRKRPLPAYVQTIGVVTCLNGAVLHDIRRVLARRWPMARVVVSACQVQGQGAALTIVAALRRMARWTDDATGRATDVVILARGGGSLEDLWPFNDESRRARRGRPPVPDRRRRRPRDRRDAGRVCGRRSRGHTVRRGRARRSRPGR